MSRLSKNMKEAIIRGNLPGYDIDSLRNERYNEILHELVGFDAMVNSTEKEDKRRPKNIVDLMNLSKHDLCNDPRRLDDLHEELDTKVLKLNKKKALKMMEKRIHPDISKYVLKNFLGDRDIGHGISKKSRKKFKK